MCFHILQVRIRLLYPDNIASVRTRLRRRVAIVAALALGGAALVATAPPASAVAPLTTGFTDDVFFDAPSVQGPWIQRTLATGAGIVLLDVEWRGVAPATPAAGFRASDPGDPRYDWAGVDYGVRALAAAGIPVALMISSAPSWAEGPRRPADATPGTWEPDAKAYGQFAAAIARRYSGNFPDPANPGSSLPAVRYWQAWAEPNLSVHLAPQWVRAGRQIVAASPGIYRAMLNSFYASVKAVNRRNVVITSGTGPFGDGIGGQRMSPALFVRELLCLHGRTLSPERCANPAHFDALAHHPYDVAVPTTAALNIDDVSAPDLGKLTRPLRKAVATGRALPRTAKQLWVTEFSYDSNPPNPQAVPQATQARWLEQSFYVFWRQGVSTVVWYLIRDQPPIPDYASAFESGVYLLDGTPKISLQAFRFPFVIESARTRSPKAWGKAPEAGLLEFQRQTGGGWVTVSRRRVRAGQVFQQSLGGPNRGSFRAVIGTDASLVWLQA